ncbi:hypothetical protein CEXT_286861 [Caerostris extrusa]|uniref:Uncharacterized protein n=1 Tax=Caerostris extrusa TaxID=172846 RepID=A0AAV4TCM8_CAEEX|nr:hypothetical protein CEXT_286861 [Caerostris extrusa]
MSDISTGSVFKTNWDLCIQGSSELSTRPLQSNIIASFSSSSSPSLIRPDGQLASSLAFGSTGFSDLKFTVDVIIFILSAKLPTNERKRELTEILFKNPTSHSHEEEEIQRELIKGCI